MNTQGRKSPPVRRSGRSDAGKRRPSSGVGSRLLIMAAIVAAVIFGVAIFFKVNTVEVQGNTIYSAEEIRSASGIQKGDNLFTLNKEAAAGSIKASLPYVETVSIIRFLPDKIVIEVKESDATFAVTTDTNTTWLINSVGKPGAVRASLLAWIITFGRHLIPRAPREQPYLIRRGSGKLTLTPMAGGESELAFAGSIFRRGVEMMAHKN